MTSTGKDSLESFPVDGATHPGKPVMNIMKLRRISRDEMFVVACDLHFMSIAIAKKDN
jgi:hypothetical protein